MSRLGKFARCSALLALGALAACVNIGGGGKAPANLYGLAGATLPAGPAVSAKPAEALVIAEPEVDRSLAVNRIAVATNDGAVAYLAGGAWIDRPARLFRNALADAIRGQSPRLVVMDDSEIPAGAQRLSGRLASFGYDARSHAAVIRYDALLRGRDGALMQRRFEAVEPVAGKPSAALVVAALGVAAGKVSGQVAEWVK